jgi:endoglucanase
MGGDPVELRELTMRNGVSGHEGAVRRYLMDQARPYCDEMNVDRMGNLLCRVRGKNPLAGTVMVAAHMDEVGLIVRSIREDGLLRYEPVGSIDARVMVSKRVLVGDGELPGVIGAKAIHLQSPEERNTPLSHEKLFIDIGCKDKASAEKRVSPGDYAAFMPLWIPFGKGFVMSKALDDRVGCYNMLRLMRTRQEMTVVYAFTVQEEVGLRGAQTAAWQIRPRCALVLEGTTANDLGGIPHHQQVCRAGGGVAISFMDRSSIAHPGMFGVLRGIAQKEGIRWQLKRYVSGGNDAGKIQNARGAVPVAVLSVPCRYIHSPASVCCLADVEAQYELALAYLAGGAAIQEGEK